MSEMTHSNLLFTRDEGDCRTTLAVVSMLTRKPVGTVEEKVAAIKEAVTRWVKATKDGNECWDQSCKDLNIGDLTLYDQSFRTWLKRPRQADLTLADIKFDVVEGSVDTTYYDCQLTTEVN
jgi:hypothetical protein